MYKFMQNYKYNECIILIFLFANFLQIQSVTYVLKIVDYLIDFCSMIIYYPHYETCVIWF